MPPYKKTVKVTDIERPISSNIFGRDIIGTNPNVSAINKTNIDLQDEVFNMEYVIKNK